MGKKFTHKPIKCEKCGKLFYPHRSTSRMCGKCKKENKKEYDKEWVKQKRRNKQSEESSISN